MSTHRVATRLLLPALALALLAACISNYGEGGGASPLAGTSWRLAELRTASDDDRVRPDDPARYEMSFGEDGRASLRLDCNRAAGGFTAAATGAGAGSLTFTPLAMTRAMCPPGSLDARIARELGFVRRYLLEGDRLILGLAGDEGSQVWTRARP
jgi:heat shock protein HslJ